MNSLIASNVQKLMRRVTWGTPQPELTALIAGCPCPPLVRAGLHLRNGDWELAHRLAQAHPTPEGMHWHALVHRHEPDFENSKYWLRQAGDSPIYPFLARSAGELGVGGQVAPGGRWDPLAFTDAYAQASPPEWTRRLDALEMTALLGHALEHLNMPDGDG